MDILIVVRFYILYLCVDFLYSLVVCFLYRKLKTSKEFIYSSHSLCFDIVSFLSLCFGIYASSSISTLSEVFL